jgi:predicted flavoprotein YhiN
MANKILIIGVGSAGVIAADKMNVPDSKKLFIDSSRQILNEVKSEGEKIGLYCKARSQCPSLYCHCFNKTEFCREIVAEYEDEIRERIINALK